jgi:hypothetical protein
MIAFQEDEKRRTPFQLRCPLFIAVGERCRNLRIQLRYVPVKRGLDLGEFFVVFIVMWSTCNTCWVTAESAIALSIPVRSIIKQKPTNMISPRASIDEPRFGCSASAALSKVAT